MTKKHPPCSVYHSVSPEVKTKSAQIYGVDDDHDGVELDGADDGRRAPMTPVEEVEADKQDTEAIEERGKREVHIEMRRPRVGARPALPIKAQSRRII